jgi:hypothetical protein
MEAASLSGQLADIQFAQAVKSLKEKGFECRTGHFVEFLGSCTIDSQSDLGETYKFVIVQKSLPKIKTIEEWSNGITIKWESGDEDYFLEDPEDYIEGHGEFEAEAWASAVENNSY